MSDRITQVVVVFVAALAGSIRVSAIGTRQRIGARQASGANEKIRVGPRLSFIAFARLEATSFCR
jgi:hypothetical protein